MSGGARPWRGERGGVSLLVRLTPKAARDAVEGLTDTAEGPALKARVRAVPEDGEANAALERLVADWLGVPKKSVELISGGKSRVKRIAVAGDGAVLEARLAERIGALETKS